MRLIALAVIVLASPAYAAERHTLAQAPAALKALIESNRDKPGTDDGCLVLNDAKPDDAIATVFRLDANRRLIILECERTMKFNIQRALIVNGDNYAKAERAALPVPKTAHPKGIISDSMDMNFDEKTGLLKSNAWEGGNCWSSRVWKWDREKFIRVSFKSRCARASSLYQHKDTFPLMMERVQLPKPV